MVNKKLQAIENLSIGLFIMRITMAALFIPFGFQKFMGLEGFSAMVWGSLFVAFLVALVELVGGLMLLLGVGTKWAGAALGIVMIGAIFIVHNPFVVNDELMNALTRLIIAGVGFGLFFTGSGKLALVKD